MQIAIATNRPAIFMQVLLMICPPYSAFKIIQLCITSAPHAEIRLIYFIDRKVRSKADTIDHAIGRGISYYRNWDLWQPTVRGFRPDHRV